MAYDNTNTGLLRRNDNKTEDRQPDFNGSCNVDGTEYRIAGWIREAGPNSKTPGRKYFSLKFTAKDQAVSYAPKPSPQPANAAPGFNNDLPF